MRGKHLSSWRQRERDASRSNIAVLEAERRMARCHTSPCWERDLRRVSPGVWACADHWPAVVS